MTPRLSDSIFGRLMGIRCTLIGNRIVDHSDVVGASQLNTWLQLIGQRQLTGWRDINIYVLGLDASYIRELTVAWSFNMFPYKHGIAFVTVLLSSIKPWTTGYHLKNVIWISNIIQYNYDNFVSYFQCHIYLVSIVDIKSCLVPSHQCISSYNTEHAPMHL